MHNNLEHFDKKELEEIINIFYSQAYEIIDELQDLSLGIESNPDTDSLKAIQRYVHTLKGDSNAVGLTAVGTLCHRVEDVLDSIKKKVIPVDSEVIDLLLGSIDSMGNLLKAAERGRHDHDIKGVLKRIDAFLLDTGRVRDGEEKNTVNKGSDALRIKDPPAQGMAIYNADVLLHPLCAERSGAAFMIQRRIESLGEVIHFHPEISGEEVETSQKFSIVFSTDMEEHSLKEKLFIEGITEEIQISPSVIPRQQETHFTGMRAKALKHEMIRVEASKVDRMMNLVGELMIDRSILEQVVKDARDNGGVSAEKMTSRLQSLQFSLDRTVFDLQRGIMKMRMVPVNNVFRKFPKIVRGLAAEKGKQVRLVIHGRETELDKGIVDGLGEPLVHIIRNSIDHGLEGPECRVSIGKPEVGVITMKAYHEAADIVIEITDDGRGIDLENLREKALERGFLAPEDAEKLSDTDIANLIFRSGLSTSETVSNISGRGVGMDAVKEAVENMRGAVEIETEKDKGTTFRLRLPLTLAVIKALLVGVGERLYAIPVSSIAEVTKVLLSDLTTVDGRDALILRDRIISLIHLHEVMKVAPDSGEKKYALVLGGGGNRRVGFLVDSLMGQQELVIKALDGRFARTRLVGGASILGDGRVVFILDTAAIYKKAVDNARERIVEAWRK